MVLDSSVWIDWLRGDPTPQVKFLRSQDWEQFILVPDLVLYEVLAGAVHEERAARLDATMRRFRISSALDPQTARYAAELYRKLRRLGITVRKPIDVLIAAFCMRDGHDLLHNDRDFDPIAKHFGLCVVDTRPLAH